MHYTNTGHSLLAKNMQALYRAGNTEPAQEVNYDEGSDGLSKAEELGLLDTDATDIEKGRKAMPIGSHATWGGVQYLKTASGWKVVGKVRGHVKENHDLIHNNEDKDKDHHAMVHDAGNMSAEEWTKKHASNLHAKYKAVHDYLHKEKVKKEDTDKVIGKTQTGKDIHNNFNHPSHKDFTSEEHATAAGAHKYQLDVLNRFNDDHTGKVDTMMHHNNQAKLHEEASKTQKPEEKKETYAEHLEEVKKLKQQYGDYSGYRGSGAVSADTKLTYIRKYPIESITRNGSHVSIHFGGNYTKEIGALHPELTFDGEKAAEQYYDIANTLNEKYHGTKKENSQSGFSTSTSGIEVGKVYQHENYGKVKVTKVEKNTGDKSDSISHHITFKTRGGEGIEETQGINGFRHGTTGDYNGTPKAAEEKPKEESREDYLKRAKEDVKNGMESKEFKEKHGNHPRYDQDDHLMLKNFTDKDKHKKVVSERYKNPADHDWSFLKTLPEKQLEKQKDLAHKQIVNIGQQHGMKESDVAKYPKQIKQALDELTYKVERIDQEIADRRNGGGKNKKVA
jgi:hypothetical protein